MSGGKLRPLAFFHLLQLEKIQPDSTVIAKLVRALFTATHVSVRLCKSKATEATTI